MSQGVSHNYAHAYAESMCVMDCTRARPWAARMDGVRLAAPQGSDGEIYNAHVTLDGYLWIYTVAVQLSQPFALSTFDQDPLMPRYYVVPYSHADGFAPQSALPQAFDAAQPMPFWPLNTTAYLFQYVTLAPVLPGNWVLFGEQGKFMPVNRQRIAGIQWAAADAAAGHAWRDRHLFGLAASSRPPPRRRARLNSFFLKL